MSEIFMTKVQNKTRVLINLVDRDGLVVASVEPDQIITLEATTRHTTFSPYSEIVFLRSETGGGVELTVRPNWYLPRDPDRPWPIALLNEAGQRVEMRFIGGRAVHVMLGIPARVDVTTDDPMAEVEKIVIQRKEVKVKNPEFEGYQNTVFQMEDKKVLRNEKELVSLEAVRATLAKKEANDEVQP